MCIRDSFCSGSWVRTPPIPAASIFLAARPIRTTSWGSRVDLDFSVRRELKEETGLDIAEFTAESGWTTVFDLPLIAHIKVLRSGESAEALRARVLDHLARERP